jgi:hypothetical protein
MHATTVAIDLAKMCSIWHSRTRSDASCSVRDSSGRHSSTRRLQCAAEHHRESFDPDHVSARPARRPTTELPRIANSIMARASVPGANKPITLIGSRPVERVAPPRGFHVDQSEKLTQRPNTRLQRIGAIPSVSFAA